MIRVELVSSVAKELGMKKEDVDNVIESVIKNIKDELNDNGEVIIRGFGTFYMKHCAAKVARNISTRETVIVPECRKPCFKPSKNILKIEE